MASYQYDGEGQRAVKNLQSGGTLYWPGPDGAPLAESDLAGNLTAEYVYFGGQRIARTDYTSGSATLKYYLTDRLGSTIGVVDATFANVLEDSDYYPYGREIPSVSSDSNHYKFTGKERDAETGYDYFGARYYGSTTGRWMSPDWANGASAVPYADFSDPQTLNLYAYVRNNPIANSDPIGHNIIADGLEQRDVWGASSGITFRDSGLAAEASLNTFIAAALEAAADAAAEEGAAEQNANRQPDGSYKATPSQLADLRAKAKNKEHVYSPSDSEGQCVTACERFTGVPGPTTSWGKGKAATDLTDEDIGTAIATFVGSGSNARYGGTPPNSGTFMGRSVGGIWFADQWPKGDGNKPVSIWFMPTSNLRNPGNTAMSAQYYSVIIVK